MANSNLSKSGMPRDGKSGRFEKSVNASIPIGSKFQKLTTLEKPYRRGKHAVVKCSCDCGGVRIVRVPELKNGKAIGCEKCPRIISEKQRFAIGERTRIHGMAGTVEYNAWLRMRLRCTDPNDGSYENYGGRGIKVCDRWMNDFSNFYADMGARPTPEYSIDRIDNNRDYEPSNCRWATRLEQRRNRRNSPLNEWNGKMMSNSQIAREFGVSTAYVWRMIAKNKMTPQQLWDKILSARSRPKTKYKYKPAKPEYQAWKSMIDRCTDPKNSAWHDYGGRGIKVCTEWMNSFDAFYRDMGPRPKGHSLDKIDNLKDYSPDNCRWSTIKEQNRNRRNVALYEYEGEMLTKADIARKFNLNATSVARMIKKGMTIEEIKLSRLSPLARRKKRV